MTEALCWSVTIWSGRPQWQEGYWLGKSGNRRWIWCSEGQRTLSTTRGRGGVKKCQNFADVFYGWPHITLNSKKRHTNNSNSSDCISSINSCSYLLCRRPHTDRRPSFLETAQPTHSKTASLPVAQQHQSRPVWNGLLSSPLQCSSVVNVAWKKTTSGKFWDLQSFRRLRHVLRFKSNVKTCNKNSTVCAVSDYEQRNYMLPSRAARWENNY